MSARFREDVVKGRVFRYPVKSKSGNGIPGSGDGGLSMEH